MLTEPSKEPRRAVFGLRAYVGSRVAFLVAAGRLLRDSPQCEVLRRSLIEVYGPEGGSPGFMAASVLMSSNLSIDDLVKLGRSIEDRLADPEHPQARESLRVDLMWVDGVKVDTPQLRLPNPDLFKHAWAISTFVAAAQDAISSSHEADQFEKALKKAPPPERTDDMSFGIWDPELERLADRDRWTSEGYDWADGLAAAAQSLAFASAATMGATNGNQNLSARKTLRAAASRVNAARIDYIEAMDSGGGAQSSDSATATAWLRELWSRSSHASAQLSLAVVFSAQGGHVRGLVLGSSGAAPSKLMKVLSVSADRDPEDTRAGAAYHNVPNHTRVKIEIARSLGIDGKPDQ